MSGWLSSAGIVVEDISPSGMTITVSGNSQQFATAFQVQLHAFEFQGSSHFANVSGISIPAALSPVVVGPVLSNFFPKPRVTRPPGFTIPGGSGSDPFYAVGPADFEVIYNSTPLLTGYNGFNKQVTGAGVTVAVLEDSDMKPGDWQVFQTKLNASAGYGHLFSLHPDACAKPGLNADELEATLDTEWVSASAPEASVVEASCATTEMQFGVQVALANLVEGTQTDATIYSVSFGGCEQENGLPFLANWSNLTEEAAAEGISVIVASGDSGSSCDRGQFGQNGLGVNGLGSNPYVLSVGGTDFLDTALHQSSRYWLKHNTNDGVATALSYVPEIRWDNSCSNAIVARYIGRAAPLAFCNSLPANVQNGIGSTGGESLYYAKPAWQSLAITGMPNDGVRDQPDVASFAANGIWNHGSLVCFSDFLYGGAPCIYGGREALNQIVGGTSVAAPAFAGVLALVTEASGAKLGNPAPRLYELAQLQFSNPTLASGCKSTLGNKISKGCLFNNVTAGDNSEPCITGTPDCHSTALSTAGVGFLSTNNGKNGTPSFPSSPGYNLVTGLGSVNITNLVYSY